MIRKAGIGGAVACIFSLLAGCSFNPFVPYNDTTGSVVSTAIGAGTGAGIAALAHASNYWIAGGALAGGAIGYYVSTLRFESGPIIQAGGKAYQIGETIGIYIPTDSLFEPNTDDFLPQAPMILDSAVVVLNRHPNNNIIISGNTSGFDRQGRELSLSERRAEKVSAYLWNEGVSPFKDQNNENRKLIFVGYGDYFPIAGNLENRAIRQNSRIQIVSYPSGCELKIDARHMSFNNTGALNEDAIVEAPKTNCRWDKYGNPIDCYEEA